MELELNQIENQPKVYKVIPVMNLICLPDITINFAVGKEDSKKVVLEALKTGDEIVIAPMLTNTVGDDFFASVNSIGTTCEVQSILPDKKDSNVMRVSVKGVKQVKLTSLISSNPCYLCEAREISIKTDELTTYESALFLTAKEKFNEFVTLIEREGRNIPAFALNNLRKASSETDPLLFINVAILFGFDMKDKLLIYNATTLENKLLTLLKVITEQIELLTIESRINEQVKASLDKNQKEYFLREKMKAISKEIGDDDEEYNEIENKINNSKMNEDVKQKALKELNRLRKLPMQSPEYSYVRNYIEELITIPFGSYTNDSIDLKKAREILDKEHSGLEKVKDRIIEILAIMKLTNKVSGQIICLAGPPGVGKTSIAKSIANALGRKFVKMSVGGVSDEAEIRGHRRTYVGAMPGRIVYNLKQAGSMNPVFLIDEIDKMTSNVKGDPASAMLEVLDPEQNSNFRDNFIEVPIDLSKVMFIATANNIQDIPAPLYDRMEVIELSSYTTNEKFEIAKNYLIPRQVEKNGLKQEQLVINDETLKDIIDEYTYEAGVRGLERTIATICRKTAVKLINDESIKTVVVDNENVKEFLGGHKIERDKKREKAEVGVVSGMSYSTIGGGVLSIEVNKIKGSGKIAMTGRLGDVMKESAQIALSAVEGLCDKWKLETEDFTKSDIHIHVPEGAIKKDGPSAGIAMATAIYSVFANKKIDNDLAMTGEITLRGNVLAIGGLKEKLFACVRARISKVIVPLQNKGDILDLPSEIVDNLKINYVSHLSEVLELAIVE